MNRHVNKIVIAMCSLAFSFFAGCAGYLYGPEAEQAWREGRGFKQSLNEGHGNGIGTPTSSSGYNPSTGYWETQARINELKRIEIQARRDTHKINIQNRKVLCEMELQRKLKELERQQRESQRQR